MRFRPDAERLSRLDRHDFGAGPEEDRQPGLSRDLFLTMQTVTRSTSGISALHKRNASPLQACCCSAV